MRRFENKPLQTKQFTTKQSPYGELVGRLPCRYLALAQTKSGKTNLVMNMLLDIYRDCFERIVVFSHSWNLDESYTVLKKYMEQKGWDLAECGYAGYNDEILANIIAEQSQLIRYQKSKGQTKLWGLCIFFDDLIDSRAAMRGRNLEILYARGRHMNISVITSTQAYRKVLNTVRMNSDHELIWRLRNGQDLEAWLSENEALVGRDILLDIYLRATSAQFSYLWVNKAADHDDDIFHPNGLGTPGEQITSAIKDEDVDHPPAERGR